MLDGLTTVKERLDGRLASQKQPGVFLTTGTSTHEGPSRESEQPCKEPDANCTSRSQYLVKKLFNAGWGLISCLLLEAEHMPCCVRPSRPQSTEGRLCLPQHSPLHQPARALGEEKQQACQLQKRRASEDQHYGVATQTSLEGLFPRKISFLMKRCLKQFHTYLPEQTCEQNDLTRHTTALLPMYRVSAEVLPRLRPQVSRETLELARKG